MEEGRTLEGVVLQQKKKGEPMEEGETLEKKGEPMS